MVYEKSPEWSVAWFNLSNVGVKSMRFLATIPILVFAVLVSSASAKPKMQVPIDDPSWVCTNTASQGPCEFDLTKLPIDQPLRVAYPKAGTEVHFRIKGAKMAQSIRVEFLPEEGWGNSLLIRTGGSTPFLALKEAGVRINRSLIMFRQNWQELEAVVLFGRGTNDIVPAIQANLAAKYFATFEVMQDPGRQPIEVRISSEEFSPH